MTVAISNAPGKEPLVKVHFHGLSVQELRQVLNRAMNTWEPQDQPSWLQDLSDTVDEALSE